MLAKLSETEIASRVRDLSGWTVANGRLTKLFRFGNFPTAILFLNKIVDPAEELSHYPEIRVNYDRVVLSLFSPPLGGITERDFELARRIDELAGQEK